MSCKKVENFLKNTELIKYDNVSFSRNRSFSAKESAFWTQVDNALEKNHQSICKLIGELQHNSINTIEDIGSLQQGYVSKVLHTLVHLVDGFIGADTAFYNLIEDSHQISPKLRRRINKHPEQFQLLQVEAENVQTLLEQ